MPFDISARARVYGSRLRRHAAAVVLVMWAIFLGGPWQPVRFPTAIADASYTILSHMHFVRGTPWGAGGVHTSGPWGFVRFPFYVQGTYWYLIVVNSALAVLLAAVLRSLLRPCGRWGALAAAALLVLLLASGDDSRWLFLLLSSVLVLRHVQSTGTTALTIAVACALGFACWVKGTFLIAVTGLLPFVLWAERRFRRLPVHCLALVGTFVVSAFAARMPISAWGRHLRHIWQSGQAYAETFSVAGSGWHATMLIALAVSAIALVLLRTDGQRRGHVVTALATLWVSFVVVKSGITRQDAVHVVRSACALVAFVVCCAVDRLRSERHVALEPRRGALTPGALTRVIAAAIGIVAVIGPAVYVVVDLQPLSKWATFVSNQLSGVRQLLRVGTGPYHADAQERARSLAARNPLPQGIDTIGVFGTFQAPVLAHQLTDTPLPVIAAYEVWTPESTAMTNQFLSGPRAPNYLLLTATNQTASTALVMTRHYEVQDSRKSYVLLKRRRTPLNLSCHELSRGTTQLNAPTALPAMTDWSVPVAYFEYDRTLLNRLLTIAYRAPEVFLVLARGGQTYAKIRLNHLVLDEGVVLASRAGSWDASSKALHRRRYDTLEQPPPPAQQFSLQLGEIENRDPERYIEQPVHYRIEECRFAPPSAG